MDELSTLSRSSFRPLLLSALCSRIFTATVVPFHLPARDAMP